MLTVVSANCDVHDVNGRRLNAGADDAEKFYAGWAFDWEHIVPVAAILCMLPVYIAHSYEIKRASSKSAAPQGDLSAEMLGGDGERKTIVAQLAVSR